MQNNPTVQTSSAISTWASLLKDELQKPYFRELNRFLAAEKAANFAIYPPENLIYEALKKTPYENVKVVIVGQDPYHGHGQAHGLSFSVPKGVPLPPSLQNIFKELANDINMPTPKNGNLTKWAEQGVLLLNATLTVREKSPLSHSNRGWEHFTDVIIEKLLLKNTPIVFLLWGKYAQNKCKTYAHLKKEFHEFLIATHPSPFSAHQGFFGCRHFSKTNAFLIQHGLQPIDWSL